LDGWADEGEGDTYPFVDVPAAILGAFCGVGHALVCAEVPVQMARFLFFAFLCGEEAAAACSAAVGARVVEAGDEGVARAVRLAVEVREGKREEAYIFIEAVLI
jgi:hypothetical protein